MRMTLKMVHGKAAAPSNRHRAREHIEVAINADEHVYLFIVGGTHCWWPLDWDSMPLHHLPAFFPCFHAGAATNVASSIRETVMPVITKKITGWIRTKGLGLQRETLPTELKPHVSKFPKSTQKLQTEFKPRVSYYSDKTLFTELKLLV